MARVIRGFLTSPMNAHSIVKGDRIISSSYGVQEIIAAQRITTPGMRPYVALFLATPGHHNWGIRKTLWDLNHPLDRVTGARTAGQI